MQSYLMSQENWHITNGEFTKPNSVNLSNERYADVEADCQEWDNKDDTTYGSIMLRIAPSLHNLAAGQTGAKALWDAIATTLGKTGAMLIYSEFKAATSI